MNDLEMELQTIRQKLQTLKASPPETVAAPWGQSRLAAPSPNLAQVTTAIETLRQRSDPSTPAHANSTSLQQFEAALATVDRLAQQQEEAIQRLQRLGDKLVHQVQVGTSADVDDIARFLADCQIVQIPTIRRNHNGYLDVGYRTVNFHQAERDASSNAAALRSRSQLFKHPLTSAPAQQSDLDQYSHRRSSKGFWQPLSRIFQLTTRTLHTLTQGYWPSRPHNSQFTVLDGAIWCVGAAIVRIVVLNRIFQLYAALWTPMAVILIVGIAVSLYRSVLSARPDPVLGYRTLMVVLGLLLGGRFS